MAFQPPPSFASKALPSQQGEEFPVGTNRDDIDGAAVSHSAELVRGELMGAARRPPHPPFGHLLPKGRRVDTAWYSETNAQERS